MKRQASPFAPSALAGTVLTLLLLGALPVQPGHAAGSAEAGQGKAIVCAACHGMDGNSLNPEWPSLAGQNETYLVRTLQAFKSGERSNVLMSSQAIALTDQDMQDLAAYFAARTPQLRAADPKVAGDGERLYRGGNKTTGIGACAGCHGPNGQGNGPAGYPSISGQHASYVAAQLKAYRSEQRSSDLNQMMRNNTTRLTDAEIEAVSSYVQGLR